MDGTNQPSIPKKGPSKMLLVGIIVAVVAIAAIAGGMMLLNNNDGTGDTNGNNNDNGTGTAYVVKNGEYIVWDTNISSGVFSYNTTLRWEFSNVTTTGYDVTTIVYNSITQQTFTNTTHADHNTTLGWSDDASIEDFATKVGTEQLTTAFGTKTVDHYRNVTVDGTETTTIDYYIGAETPVVYKTVTTMADTDDPEFNVTQTTVVTDTNNDVIRNGND